MKTRCFFLALMSPAWLIASEPSEVPREDFWFPDGTVHAILATNGLVYVGGSFNSLSRPNAPTSGGFDQFSGSLDPDFPTINGAIHTIILDGSGGWFVGGRFSMAGNLARNNLVHIRADRTVDPEWQADTDAVVLAVALSGETLYVGGSFNTIAGQPRNYLAALNATTAEVTDWNPDVVVPPIKPKPIGVRALTIARGLVYVAGGFVHIGGRDREDLAALDPVTGLATDWFPISFTGPESGQVIDALAVSGDTVYVGGSFIKAINTVPRNSAAAFDATRATNNLLPWNPNANGPVLALVALCDQIYVGGSFTSIGGQSRSNLATVDPLSGAASAWNPDADGLVQSLLLAGNSIYIGGQFSRVGGQPRPRLASVDLASGQANTWNPRPTFSVAAMAISGNTVFAGGAGVGVIRRNLAALNARTGQPVAWDPNPDGSVYAFALGGDILYVGGDFLNIGGQPRQRLAAVSSVTSFATSWNPQVNGYERTNGVVESVVVSGNTVYVSGSFTNIGTQARSHVAAINANTGRLLPWHPAANDDVRTLRVVNQTVYLGGRFTQIAGQTRRRIAAVDVSSGNVIDWDPVATDSVRDLEVLGNTVLAGGLFSNIGGSDRNRLASLHRATGLATSWNPNAENTNLIGVFPRTSYINALEAAGDIVYVGGLFNRLAGASRANLAAVDVTSGVARTWNPQADMPVIALATGHDSVYAGGSFRSIGGQFQPNLAAFPPVGSPRITQHPHSQRVGIDAMVSFSAEAVGIEPLAYQWQFNGTNIPGATSSSFEIASAQVSDSGEYTVVVTNSLGLINSRSATLTVLSPLRIVTQPMGQTVAPGATVTLSVEVEGHPPPIYQWRLNGASIPGAIYPTLTLSNVQPASGGSYNVVVANVSGALSSDGAVLLVASPLLPLADDFAKRSVIADALGVGSGSNVGSTREPDEPRHADKRGGRSVWIEWQAPASGIATFNTRGSSFDTLLGIYQGTALRTLTNVVADEDRAGFATSVASFNAEAGAHYIIAIDGLAGASGNIVLSWSLDTSTVEFPRIISQPFSRTVARGDSVVFTVTAAASLTPLTYQWYFGCRLLGGETNHFLAISNVTFINVGGYHCVIRNSSSHPAESAEALLEIGPVLDIVSQDKLEDIIATLSEPPAFAGAAGTASGSIINVAMGSVTPPQLFDNTGSSTSVNEPNHCAVLGGASKWFAVHPVESATMVIDTIGSSIDTVLAVYLGPNVLQLSLVACDDNGAPDRIRSLTSFEASNTTNYWVAVDGVNGAVGNIQLNWKLGRSPRDLLTSPPPRGLRQGQSLILSVNSPSAIPPPAYQWLFNGTVLTGETNDTLQINNLQAAHAGHYSVIVSNYAGFTNHSFGVIDVALPLRVYPALLSSNGTTYFRLTGDAPANKYVIEASTSLLEPWLPLHTNTSADRAPIDFLNPQTNTFRYYRVVSWP
jgi:Ig-like domain-containing protein/beta-propeller uncharacterized protein DUF5122